MILDMLLQKNLMESEIKNGQEGESEKARVVWLVNMRIPPNRSLSFCIKIILQAISILVFTIALRVRQSSCQWLFIVDLSSHPLAVICPKIGGY